VFGISEASPIFILGGTVTAFLHLQFQYKNAYFKGKWQAVAARDAI
jgi:hypothetical protein